MKEEIKEKIWNEIRYIISKYEISCGEDIYQMSRIQDNAIDILYGILSPLLDELEKINIEEIGYKNFNVDELVIPIRMKKVIKEEDK